MLVRTLALVALVGWTIPAWAQHTPRAQTPATTAPKEATQFDFLVGQWELVVTPKVAGLAARIHGAPRLLGTWKGWRVLDGYGVEDELRIVDGSGNPSALSLSVRVWSTTERRWVQSATDAYRGRVSTANAVWQNGDMVVTGRGTDAEGKVVVTRSRFSAIAPTAFRFVQDRSMDDGATWDEKVLIIEAKRVAPVAPR